MWGLAPCKQLDYAVHLSRPKHQGLLCQTRRTTEKHEEAVREVLTRLRAARLVFNLNKSKLFCSTIDFLGHNISVSGITPIAQNTTKLLSFSTPADKAALKRFLGSLNYN